MDRRTFLCGLAGTLTAPLTGEAQQPDQIYRVGFLVTGQNAPTGVRETLGKHGYVEGRNLVIEQRVTDNPRQFSINAAELVRLKVTVIFAEGPAALKAAANSSTRIGLLR